MAMDTYGSSGARATFRTRLMGFDKEEVQTCVHNLASDYEEAQRLIDRLTARLKALEDSKEQAPAQTSTGVQLERVLASAHKVAEDIKNDADIAAKKILADAQEEAARLRSQAESDATALTKTASTRLVELNAEIERTQERRDIVHAQLYRAAEHLDELSRGIRATVRAGDAPDSGWLKTQVTTRA
jgi:cell division septum initiation protein DivIVA